MLKRWNKGFPTFLNIFVAACLYYLHRVLLWSRRWLGTLWVIAFDFNYTGSHYLGNFWAVLVWVGFLDVYIQVRKDLVVAFLLQVLGTAEVVHLLTELVRRLIEGIYHLKLANLHAFWLNVRSRLFFTLAWVFVFQDWNRVSWLLIYHIYELQVGQGPVLLIAKVADGWGCHTLEVEWGFLMQSPSLRRDLRKYYLCASHVVWTGVFASKSECGIGGWTALLVWLTKPENVLLVGLEKHLDYVLDQGQLDMQVWINHLLGLALNRRVTLTRSHHVYWGFWLMVGQGLNISVQRAWVFYYLPVPGLVILQI